MILCLLVLTLLAWYISFRYRRRNMYRLASQIPVIRGSLPVIGIAKALSGTAEDILKTLQQYSYEAMEHDGLVKGWLGHILYQLLTNPSDIEMSLKTCMEKDDLHRFIKELIGSGAIFASVPIWKRRRKVLVPAFSPKIIENFIEVFSEQSEILAKRLDDYVNKGTFDIWPFISSYAMDAVCDTIMGVKINAQENSDSQFLKSMTNVLNLFCERIFHLWLQPDWLFRLFPQFKEHQRCIYTMHSFVNEVIEKKREDLKAKSGNISEEDHEFDLNSYSRKTFLDLLITHSGGKKGYTNVELREEILTLAIAGSDTSATAVGYTLLLLGKYPDIQDKVHQELYDVFEDTNRPLVKDDLTKLKYLERVVKESLRLFPPVPFIIRKVLDDTTLPSGRVLPGGSGAVISIWGAHRDPRYWGPDAEHFDPDRFLPERFKLANACSYMPFSNGPRSCIGYQYALMSIKTSLSAILRRYHVVTEPEDGPIPHIRTKLEIMMKPVDGYQLCLKKRITKHL